MKTLILFCCLCVATIYARSSKRAACFAGEYGFNNVGVFRSDHGVSNGGSRRITGFRVKQGGKWLALQMVYGGPSGHYFGSTSKDGGRETQVHFDAYEYITQVSVKWWHKKSSKNPIDQIYRLAITTNRKTYGEYRVDEKKSGTNVRKATAYAGGRPLLYIGGREESYRFKNFPLDYNANILKSLYFYFQC